MLSGYRTNTYVSDGVLKSLKGGRTWDAPHRTSDVPRNGASFRLPPLVARVWRRMVVARPPWRIVAAVPLLRWRRAVVPKPAVAARVVWHVALAVVVALALGRRVPIVAVAATRLWPPRPRVELTVARARVEVAVARRRRAALVEPARLAVGGTAVVAAAGSRPLVAVWPAVSAAKASAAVGLIVVATWRRRRVAPGR